jgi:hypothetical protein
MKDKIKIEQAIRELDEKRKDAMTQIYEHTNKYLNSIYSSLLPGTKAKLAILPGKGLMDGLELKVAFNNTWKGSLSELSGGQRSLLALSLILSLLRFKPAPFYILDEIDAALDLSHTANLGVMIKEQFPQRARSDRKNIGSILSIGYRQNRRFQHPRSDCPQRCRRVFNDDSHVYRGISGFMCRRGQNHDPYGFMRFGHGQTSWHFLSSYLQKTHQ